MTRTRKHVARPVNNPFTTHEQVYSGPSSLPRTSAGGLKMGFQSSQSLAAPFEFFRGDEDAEPMLVPLSSQKRNWISYLSRSRPMAPAGGFHESVMVVSSACEACRGGSPFAGQLLAPKPWAIVP